MSADGTRDRSAAVAPAPERRGPRHAAPRKPLFTRFHMPAGKAVALAAMPTAVLMGMGFTPTLAQADEQQPLSNSLTADEYRDCVAAPEDSEDGASSSPTPSASARDTASPDEESATEPSPSASAGGDAAEDSGADPDAGEGDAGEGTDGDPPSSPDSGSDDEDGTAPAGSEPSGDRAGEPGPSPPETERNALEELGDALTDLLTPKGRKTDEATARPTPSAPASAEDGADTQEESAGKAAGEATDAVEDAAGEAADRADEAAEGAEGAEDAAAEAGEATAAPGATAPPGPSPSGSATTDAGDCPVATDAEGGVDNKILLPEDPWFLNASSLTLKGADYQGIVEVRTASGRIKKVLKYVVSDGTDIGDLHQTVEDKMSGRTHHVRAAEGSTSTIRDGDTVMYTESISGKLLGLIPVTFDPENPPPLNIPLIHFTEVTVQQAGQFGGTLRIPGLSQYVT